MDRYVVMEYLAEGGMGAIYLGKKLGAGGFEKQVVLKQLLPEFTRQPEFIDLFLREARLSASLDHANIIHTIDLVTAGEEYFIVMEFLDGADLRTLTRRAKRRQRQIAPSAGLYIARELLSALAYAHGKLGPDGRPLGLIHRDVSPSNILISGSGEVKLTDFGIAKASTHNSIFYRVKGKVGYMSPEQARSEELDHRSDLYSLAVCLYEVLTGERLFVNVGLTTSAEEMYSQPVPAISSKIPGLPRELDELMFRALAVDPNQRFQSAGEFQENLLRCAHRHGLLMSGAELADHLREACGSPSIWRDEDNLGDDAQVADREGTEQLAIGPTTGRSGSDELLSVAEGGASPINESQRRRQRARTSVTKLTWLQGMELTSMIKLDGDTAGAEPLFDVENLGRDSGIRSAEANRLVELGATSTGFEAALPPPDVSLGASAMGLPAPTALPSPLALPPATPRRRGLRPVLAVLGLLVLGGGITAGIGYTGPTLELSDELLGELAASSPRAGDAPEPEAAAVGEQEAGGDDPSATSE
jgi:eukaryotic-like serine/threonine-protein kinase